MRQLVRRVAASVPALVLAAMEAVSRPLSGLSLGRLLRRVSLPRMREHRARTGLTALGVALGVAVLVSVLLVNRSIVRGVTHSIDDLAGRADLQIGAEKSGFDESLLDAVQRVQGVYKVTPMLQQIVTLRTRDGGRERLLVLGVDLLGKDDEYFRSYASPELEEIRRDPLRFLNSSTNFIVSRRVAERLGLRLHDKVSVSTASGLQEFEVWGFIDDLGVGRAFGGAVGVMYYPAMQVAFGRGRSVDRIDVAVTPGQAVEPVARRLEQALGAGIAVERPAMRGERIHRMLLSVRTGLGMSSSIAVIAGAFLVFSTISISIVQRRRELGILRALGMTQGQLRGLIVLEGVLFGVVGSALGLLIGIGLAKGMLIGTGQAVDQVYFQQNVTTLQIDGWLLLAGAALGLGVSVAAAYLASQRSRSIGASAANPAQQARSGPAQVSARQPALRAAGLLLITLVLVALPPVGNMPIAAFAACVTSTLFARACLPTALRWAHLGLRRVQGWRPFSTPARLASDNLPRDLDRSASTASGLMVGAALSVMTATFVTCFIASLNTWTAQTVPGDLFVTSGAAVSGLSSRNTPMADVLRADFAGLPGVTDVRRLRIVDSDYRGSTIKLVASDTAVFVKHSRYSGVNASSDEIARALRSGQVVVSENFARLFDVQRGDQIALGSQRGTRQLEVGGVVVDYTSDAGTVLMDWETYTRNWDDPRVDTYELHLAAGADAEAMRARINASWGEKHDLFVLTNREFRGEFVKASDSIFSLLRALELVTLTVAVLGMITGILATVLDRVRELAVLRALGMLRAQLQRMVLLEATFLGGVGTALGIALGIALGYLMLRRITAVEIGWYLGYQVPLRSILEVAAVALPASALSGFFPARKAAQLNVADALDYE